MSSKLMPLVIGLLCIWSTVNIIFINDIHSTTNNYQNYIKNELKTIKQINRTGIIFIQNHIAATHPERKDNFNSNFLPIDVNYSDSLALAYPYGYEQYDSVFIRKYHSRLLLIDELYQQLALNRIIQYGELRFTPQGLCLNEFKLFRTHQDSIYLGTTGSCNNFNHRTYLEVNNIEIHPKKDSFSIQIPHADSFVINSFTLFPKKTSIGLDTISYNFTYHP